MLIKNNRAYLFMFFFSLLFFLIPVDAYAIKGESIAVKPVYPKNQEGGEMGYFNLQVSPNDYQELELEIRNDSKQDITVNLKVIQATTSDTGVISYGEDKKIDESTKYPFRDIADLEKDEVKIPGNGSKKIKIYLTIPSETFSGKLIGGVTVSEKRELTDNEKEQSVVNEFQYAIPIVLYENKKIVEPEIELINIEPGLRNYRPYIEATLRNSSFINVNKMLIEGKIINQSNNELLVTRKETNYQMAPTSSFNFGFDLQNSDVIPGDYAAEFKIIADDKEFNFKKLFSINKAQAKEINSQNLYSNDPEKAPLWLIILIIIFLLIAILIIIFLLRKNVFQKKKRKKIIQKRKKEKKKRKKVPNKYK